MPTTVVRMATQQPTQPEPTAPAQTEPGDRLGGVRATGGRETAFWGERRADRDLVEANDRDHDAGRRIHDDPTDDDRTDDCAADDDGGWLNLSRSNAASKSRPNWADSAPAASGKALTTVAE